MNPQNLWVKGFTLVELMVVVAIAAIMFAMMLPNVSGYMSSLEINAAAEELATDLRSARQLAISKNVKSAVVINVNARQYSLYRMPMPGEPLAGPTWSDGTNNYFPVTTRSLSGNGTIGYQSIPNASSSAYILFNSDGSSSGGTLYLMPDKEYSQGVQQKKKQILAMASTGHIRVLTWQGGWK